MEWQALLTAANGILDLPAPEIERPNSAMRATTVCRIPSQVWRSDRLHQRAYLVRTCTVSVIRKDTSTKKHLITATRSGKAAPSPYPKPIDKSWPRREILVQAISRTLLLRHRHLPPPSPVTPCCKDCECRVRIRM